jgi:hypothetical protein
VGSIPDEAIFFNFNSWCVHPVAICQTQNTQYFTSIATKCSLYILKFHFLYRFMQYARFVKVINANLAYCINLYKR